jgi:hypothetical protein
MTEGLFFFIFISVGLILEMMVMVIYKIYKMIYVYMMIYKISTKK